MVKKMKKEICERCGKSLEGLAHTTSKLNTEVICTDCKQEERAMQLYKFASCIEDEQCRAGNLNYEGVLNDYQYCLLECKIEVCGEKRHFKFIGTVEIYDDELTAEEVYVVELNRDGKSVVEFNITSLTWAGSKITPAHAFAMEVNRSTRKEKSSEILHLHDTVKLFLEEKAPNIVAVTCAEREVPKYITIGLFHEQYELLLCTNQYAYYGDDDFVMVDACTGELIADNAFAENGYWQTLEAIIKGEEKILYIREEDEDAVNEQLDEIRKEMDENE